MHRKGLVIGIIILMLGVNIGSSFAGDAEVKDASPVGFDGNTLYVGGSGSNNYTSIQDAIDDALDGDTVFVYDDSSPYYEDIRISNSINLIGEDKYTTSIIGDSIYLLMIFSPYVTVCNFSILFENTPKTAINLLDGQYATIKDNIIDNCNIGIYLMKSSKNTICNNIFLNDGEGITISRYFIQNKIINNSFYGDGNGINIRSLDGHSSFYNNTISGNTINDKPLLYFENQSHKIIDYNVGQIILLGCNDIIIRNQELAFSYAGIIIYYSENILIENNSIQSCYYGIYIGYSGQESNVKIFNNSIRLCQVGCFIRNSPGCFIANNEISLCITIGTGLIVSGSPFCNVTNNIIKFNFHGFTLDSSNCYIFRNEISNNLMTGIFLSDCVDNQIRFNNFKRNSLPIVGDARFHFEKGDDYQNLWYGNYWNRPRFLPKLIFGSFYFEYTPIPAPFTGLQVDWNPAQEPYDIGV